MISIRHGGHYYLMCHGPNTRKLCDPLVVWPSSHMCVMHPIIITFLDPGLCRAQPTPNATFTPSWLLARGSWLPMSPLSMTRPAATNFRIMGIAERSFFQQPNFLSRVHATRNASPYFFYLMCEFSPQHARYMLVHAYCQCPVLVTALSCCATHTVLSLWHRFLWRCMSATCGLLVRKNGALLAK